MNWEDALKIAATTNKELYHTRFIGYGYNYYSDKYYPYSTTKLYKPFYEWRKLLTNISKEHFDKYLPDITAGNLIIGRALWGEEETHFMTDYIGLYETKNSGSET